MTARSWDDIAVITCFISSTSGKSTSGCLSMKIFPSEQLKGDSEKGCFVLGSGPDVTVCDTQLFADALADMWMCVCVTWEAWNLEAIPCFTF